MPIYLADYVLMTYGTGAIMAVPGQDQRDWDFATEYDLPIVRTVQPPDDWQGEAYTGDGPAINSAWLDGLNKADAIAAAIDWLEEQGIGVRTVNYRLRDWLLSRQRYWGCPIPIVYCPEHGPVPVPDDELPVLAPDDVEFLPTGESPLRFHEGFLQHDLSEVRWSRRARDRHHGHVRRLVVVLPALLRSVERRRPLLDEKPCRGGCPSTSTSAASSTRSCT